DELHGDVVRLADLAEVEDVRDVHVRELPGDLGFVDEHLHQLLVRREPGQDHLQGDELLEALDALGRRQVQLGHASGRDLANHAVRPELPFAWLFGPIGHVPSSIHAAFTPPDCAGWCAAACPGCTNTPTRRSGTRVPRSNVQTTSVAMPWATFT